MTGIPHLITHTNRGTPASPGDLVGPTSVPNYNAIRGKAAENLLTRDDLSRDTRLQALEAWIKYSGTFDLEALYKLLIRWFEEREFEVYEQYYKAKFPELEIRWEATKKIDGFRMDKVNIHIHLFDMKEVEVEKDGVKKKLVHARTRIWFWPEIVTDYPDIFGERKFNAPFEKKLLRFLGRYMLRRDIELREIDRLYYELWGLHAQIKAFFGMEARGNAY